MNKSILSAAITTLIGITASTVNADPVTGFTIQDVGSNASGSGAYSSMLDGISGAFAFSSFYLNVKSYPSASLFTGDVASGTIFGEGVANPTGSFSTGFIFSSAPFIPFTFGSGLNAELTPGDGTLTVTTLDFGGEFGGAIDFFGAPDTNYPLQALWSRDRGGGEWDVAMRWGHLITTAEDPSVQFAGFIMQWALEGCMTTNATGKCVELPFPPVLSISIPGGMTHECSGVDGDIISMNALINIHASDAIDTVSWTLDGNPVASGESVNIGVPLGAHTVEATVTTILGNNATDSAMIVVEDTTAPVVSPKFLDKKTGVEVTVIENKDKVIPSFGVSDICDPVPEVVSATAGVPVEDVDTIRVKTNNNSKVKVSIKGLADTVELSVVAKDASGNMSSGEAELIINN